MHNQLNNYWRNDPQNVARVVESRSKVERLLASLCKYVRLNFIPASKSERNDCTKKETNEKENKQNLKVSGLSYHKTKFLSF